ncbi:MAG: CBS domain-containing protein [Candidatus Micrarchaeota archaeon]
MSSELKVGDVMTKTVIMLDKGSPLPKAAKLMKEYDVGSILIVDEKNAIGIITERDIIHKAIALDKDILKLKVDNVMSKPLRVIKPDITLEDAAKVMKDNKIKRLPVVNNHNELIGILSEGDLARLLPSVIDLIEERDIAQR